MLTKEDLAIHLSEETGRSLKEAREAVDAVFERMAAELAKGGDVHIYGWGKLSVKDRPERPGNNPRTGEKMTVAAHRAVRFSAGAVLTRQVNAA